MSPAEDYRAKATEYERLTRVTKSLRESGKYRQQAQVYRALALGEEPEILPATRAGANRCPNCDAPNHSAIRIETFVGPARGTSLAMSEV